MADPAGTPDGSGGATLRPAWMLAALALGIATATRISPPPWLPALPALWAGGWLVSRRRWSPVPLILLFILLGAALAALALPKPGNPAHLAAWTDRGEQLLQGRLQSVELLSGGRQVLVLDDLARHDPAGSHTLRGKLRLTLEQSGTFSPGERIQLRTTLKSPQRFSNPGEFDWPLHLAARQIEATAFLPNARGIARLEQTGRVSVAGRIAGLRLDIAERLEQLSAPRRAALLRALLIGDKGGLFLADAETLARSGTAHLFSISGFHLGLVFLFLYAVTAWLYRRSSRLMLWQPAGRVLPVSLLPALWVYLHLAGAGLPTQRAFVMAVLGAGLLLVERRSRPLNLLTCALFGLLLCQPLALFSPSLQLSAAGLAGILLLMPRWTGRLAGLPRGLKAPLQLPLISLAATVTTAPLIWWHFHQVSLAGPLANLLAVPLIGFAALPAGLAGLILQPLAEPPGDLLLHVSAWLCETTLDLLAGLISIGGLRDTANYADPLQAVAVALLLGALLLPPAVRHRWLIRLGLGIAGAGVWLLPWPPVAALQLTVLSVGQGESLLVSRQGYHLLVDGGGLHDPSFDVGRRLVAPALGRLGIHSLDAVLLTHNHPDHWQGLVSILADLPVGRFLSAIPPDQLPLPLQDALEHGTIPVTQLPTGWNRLPGQDIHLFVPPQTAADPNDRSVAVYAGTAEQGLLLTGDLAQDGVTILSREQLPGPVSLLKLPHHGSRNSGTGQLLERLQPELAVASLGRHNPFGFPHSEVTDQLAARGTRFFRTDRDGLLRFTCGPSGWLVESWRNRLFH